jgi:hypothetical protein
VADDFAKRSAREKRVERAGARGRLNNWSSYSIPRVTPPEDGILLPLDVLMRAT